MIVINQKGWGRVAYFLLCEKMQKQGNLVQNRKTWKVKESNIFAIKKLKILMKVFVFKIF